MQIAYLFPGQPWNLIAGILVPTEGWESLDVERTLNLAAANDTALFPLVSERERTLNEVLLAPDFYEECRRRIEGSEAFRRGEEQAVMAAVLAEGAGEIAGDLKRIVDAPPGGDGLSPALLRARILWGRLEEIITAAFPEGMALLGTAGRVAAAVDPSLPNGGGEAALELHRLFHPPSFLDRIAAHEPRVLFLSGSFPLLFPLAAAWAARLRKRLPRALFVAVDDGSDIYSSPAQSLEKILRSPALFDHLDGVVVYQDLADRTLCDIVEKLEKGAESLEGIENVAFRAGGKVSFAEPSPERTARHLARTRLGPALARLLSVGSVEPVAGEYAPNAVIVPTRQPCYWNRCRFCPTGSQHFLGKDPHLERRAAETADLLGALAGRGVEMTFVGREVVPPLMLKGIVGALRSAGDSPRWSYEGRFETFYTAEFIADLAASGCRGIIFGLESPSDRLNGLMDKYPPGFFIGEIEGIIGGLDRAGVAVHVNTIYDLPGSTAADVERHGDWLRRMFDTHRLFHFNTNAFRLMPGSPLSRDPSSAGLEPVDGSDGAIPLLHPFRRREEGEMLPATAGGIWEKVFGASSWRGGSLDELHGVYHEGTAFSFRDAARGRNLFKEIGEELEPFREPGNLMVRLSETVEIVEAEGEGDGDLWLADVGSTAGWVRLSRPFWSLLEACLDEEKPFDAVLEERRPDLPDDERREARRIVTSLLADGFLAALPEESGQQRD